jgi:hypothetical protein
MHRFIWAGTAAFILVTFSAFGATSESITLPFAKPASTLAKSFHLPISVGDGPPHIVNVDTGSRGIVIPRSRLGSVYSSYNPKKTFEITYTSSGRIFRGEVVQAAVLLGAGRVKTAPTAQTEIMDVQIADEADCAPNHPDCTLPASLNNIGMMGVGFARHRAPPAMNPFLRIKGISTGDRRAAYLITRFGVTLSPSDLELTDFKKLNLTQSLDVADDWQPAQVCFTLQKVPNFQPECGELLVDTGLGRMIVQSAQEPNTVMTTTPHRLDPDVHVRIDIPDRSDAAATWTFITGADNDSAPPRVQWGNRLHNGVAFVNTGYHLFARYDYFFDATNGIIGFRPRTSTLRGDVNNVKRSTALP